MKAKTKKTKKAKKIVSRKKVIHASAAKKMRVLEVSSLGIAPEQILDAACFPEESPQEVEVIVPAYSALASAVTLAPPPNLPTGPGIFRRSLVSPRTSFWLGVGFGMLIVGVLGALVWQFVKVDVVEAVVLGLTRS